MEGRTGEDPDFKANAKALGVANYIQTEMKDKGVPIDGVGVQSHLKVYPEDAGITFKTFADMGLLVHASELDLAINNEGFINGWLLGGTPVTDLYNNEKFREIDYAHGKSFNMVVRAYINNVPEALRYGITVWGLADRYCMTEGNPWGYPDWPSMYGKSFQSKRGYHGVLEGLLGIDWNEKEQAAGWTSDWRWQQGYEENPNL